MEDHVKHVGDLNSFSGSLASNVKSVTSEITRISKICEDLKKPSSNTPAQTYASITNTPSTHSTPLRTPVSSANTCTPGLKVPTSVSTQASSNEPTVAQRSRAPFNTGVTSRNENLFPVPDIDQSACDNHEEDTPSSENFFRGVSYTRKARFYLSRIDRRTSQDGIMNFAASKGIKITHIRMFKPKAQWHQLSAKINIPFEHAR